MAIFETSLTSGIDIVYYFAGYERCIKMIRERGSRNYTYIYGLKGPFGRFPLIEPHDRYVFLSILHPRIRCFEYATGLHRCKEITTELALLVSLP
jgi:hypothetical protein